MHILLIGVDHRNTPVEIREHLAVRPAQLERALTELGKAEGIVEDVILSTCNRTELYVVCDRLQIGCRSCRRFFARWFQIEAEQFSTFLVIKEDTAAIRHLFRVACGLESMIPGETQILGQVRESFLAARQARTVGTFFNELFQQALHVGKCAQEETKINDHPLSVSYTAVKLVRSAVGFPGDKTATVIGAGDMGRQALNHLIAGGWHDITIVNRTKAKAEALARAFRIRTAAWSALDACIERSDLIFSAVTAPRFLITADALAALMNRRAGRPLTLMDVGVPRTIDPRVAQLKGVHLFDVDDLEQAVDQHMAARRRAMGQIERLIDRQQARFDEWLHTLSVVPVIAALRRKALTIHDETMKRLEHKLPGMTAQEREVISSQTRSMMNQLLREPIHNIKEVAGREHGLQAVDHFAQIFNIAAPAADAEDAADLQPQTDGLKLPLSIR